MDAPASEPEKSVNESAEGSFLANGGGLCEEKVRRNTIYCSDGRCVQKTNYDDIQGGRYGAL